MSTVARSGGLANLVEILPLAVLVLDNRRQQLGVAEDRGQEIVEVVGDAAGELADRIHLLRLDQLRFELPAFGDIDADADAR